MTKYFLITVITVSGMAAASSGSERDPPSKQVVEAKKTETVSLPTGGVIHFVHPIGDLNIEGWDNPNIEITTIKSTADLYAESDAPSVKAEMQKVALKTERKGNDVVITTDFPRYFGFAVFGVHGYPLLGYGNRTRFNLEYHISVPRAAKLLIDHAVGAVNVDDVTGDIEAHVKQGEIMLRLPEGAKYNIDAKSTYGNVNSDFPGELHRHWIGQAALANPPGAAQKLKLRMGYGDIVLLAIHVPKYPASTPDKSVPAGRSGL